MENRNRVLKRVLACVMVVLMAVTAVPMSGFVGLELPKLSEMFATVASAFSENGYTYSVADGKATITGCDSSISGDIVIPDTLGGYPVMGIGESAFEDCVDLTDVTVQSGVTNIDERAFYGCIGLTDIEIPNTVINIGDYSFYNCKALTRITIPEGIISIGNSAFYNCKELTNITIPDSIERIGSNSFNNTTWFDTQSPGDVYLGNFYYRYKGSMLKNTSVIIKNGTSGIADGAFESCSGLINVLIPDTLLFIGSKAFRYCDNLINVTNSNSLKSIGDYAFLNCTSLTSITFPIKLTSVGCLAFGGCTGVSKVYWNAENVKDFRDKNGFAYDVFSYLGKETSGVEIIFGNTVNSIPSHAFDCKTYDWDAGEYVYTCGSIKSVSIGGNTTRIGTSAFKGCSGLTNITIPESVVDIGDGAFEDCFGITKINWNAKNVNDFEYSSYVFGNAGSKSQGIDVVFGNEVKKIPVYTFGSISDSYRVEIKTVTVGNKVTEIGKRAFYNCTSLASITISDSVEYIGNDALFNTEWYNEQPFGDVYAGRVYYKYKGKIIENTSVVIKDGTKGIADNSFEDQSELISITIPNSVKYIGDSAFEGCYKLTSLTIPGSVKTIGNKTFYSCYDLSNVILENGIENIGEDTFRNIGIEKIIIPDSVKSIGQGAFSRCYNLTSVSIGNGVEIIKGGIDPYDVLGTFEQCPLTKISFGKSVKTIEANAFYGIESIPEVYYAGSEAEWKNISIDQTNDMILRANMHYNADISHTHSYASKVTKAATCTENGVKTFSCDCGKTYTETIPATGHKTSSWITDKAATCTAGGTRHKECTVCKTVLSTGTIAAKGHSFVSKVTAATCTSIGYETKTCKTCGECHFVRKIPAKGHTLKTDVEPATFTESGLSPTSCKTCGTITKATLIKRIASVTLSATKYTYNGKTQTPSVVVKDSAGKVLKNKTDYTVSYASGRKNPGKYAVKVTFKGNYSGTKTLYFTIAPATPTLSVTAGAKKATLKWTKRSEATGYVVYMATSKTGKYTKIATIKNNGTVSMTKTGLTTGKTYYFKVAAYKTVSGKTIYSGWSAVKGVKIK